MSVAFSTIWVFASITFYPAFGDVIAPVHGNERFRIEASADKGLMVELIVACPKGTTILSYSKLEKVYCGPRKGCARSFPTVARAACGAD